MNCKRWYADLVFCELERNFNLKEISVLACWNPKFPLKFLNTRISRILYHSICYAPITKLWETFVKTLTFRKNQACCTYAFIGYDFVRQIFINDIETSIQRCSTLLHCIVWHSLTMIYCSRRLYIFKSELTDCLCLITKPILKNKKVYSNHFWW